MRLVVRNACRGILITPDQDILLLKIREPSRGWVGWIAPGGGLDKDEDPVSGLRRELKEEVGLEAATVGPKIWTRIHTFSWLGRLIEQHESYYWVPVSRFSPNQDAQPDENEKLTFQEFRWWNLKEIETSSEIFVPRRLPHLVRDILQNGIPSAAIDAGI